MTTVVPLLLPTILYVEDDDDIRSVVTEVLTSEGFDVHAVSSAEDALGDLTKRTFDLLLTDYRLSRENADWLLREGTARGLLSRTAVVVLSSDPKPKGIEGYTFLRKPIDLDVFSAAIARALGDRIAPLVPPSVRPSEPQANLRKLVLTLYVTTTSRGSQKAIRNLHRIVAKFETAKIRLSICDVERPSADVVSGQSIEEDRIVVTPTLVVRAFGPKVSIAGDLSDAAMVEGVIERGLAELAGGSP